MANIGGVGDGNGENERRTTSATTREQDRLGGNGKSSGTGLTRLVTLVSYIVYAVILFVSPHAEVSRKLLAGALFLVTAPFCIGAGGFIGNLITPSFVIAGDAWELLKARLFWWVGPRFIGALIAAFFATLIGAPTILNKAS